MQISQVMASYFNQILIKYDKRYISQFYQKLLILCRKILLDVLHNMSLTVLLPWQQWFQTSLILKAFLTAFGFPV